MLQPHFLDPRQELAIMNLSPEVLITVALNVKMSFNQQHVKSGHESRPNSAKGHTCTAWGPWAAPALDERRKQSSLKLSPCLCLLLTTFQTESLSSARKSCNLDGAEGILPFLVFTKMVRSR